MHGLCNQCIWKLCQEMNQGTRTLIKAEQKLNLLQAFALYQPVQPSKESLSAHLGLIVLVLARGLNSNNSERAEVNCNMLFIPVQFYTSTAVKLSLHHYTLHSFHYWLAARWITACSVPTALQQQRSHWTSSSQHGTKIPNFQWTSTVFTEFNLSCQ